MDLVTKCPQLRLSGGTFDYHGPMSLDLKGLLILDAKTESAHHEGSTKPLEIGVTQIRESHQLKGRGTLWTGGFPPGDFGDYSITMISPPLYSAENTTSKVSSFESALVRFHP